MKRKILEMSGLIAIQIIRKEKLMSGHPFMINSPLLPAGQCYLEYPDGSIQIVTLSRSRKDFDLVRILSEQETTSLKTRLQLI